MHSLDTLSDMCITWQECLRKNVYDFTRLRILKKAVSFFDGLRSWKLDGSHDKWGTVTRKSNIDGKSYLRGPLLFNGWVFLSLTKGTPSAHEPVSMSRLIVVYSLSSGLVTASKNSLLSLHCIFPIQAFGCIEWTDRKWSQLLLTISFLLSLFHSFGEQTEIWESERDEWEGMRGMASFRLQRW